MEKKTNLNVDLSISSMNAESISTGLTRLGEFFKTRSYFFNYSINRKRKEELEALLVLLNMYDKEGFIGKGLEYFRYEFRIRPYQYPGDSVYYELFSIFIKQGQSIEASYLLIIENINREMTKCDVLYSLGFNYKMQWL